MRGSGVILVWDVHVPVFLLLSDEPNVSMPCPQKPLHTAVKHFLTTSCHIQSWYTNMNNISLQQCFLQDFFKAFNAYHFLLDSLAQD